MGRLNTSEVRPAASCPVIWPPMKTFPPITFTPILRSLVFRTHLGEEEILSSVMVKSLCQEAFNRRLPVCCFGSVRNPLVLINS